MVVHCGPGQEFKSRQGLKFLWEFITLIHGFPASLWAYLLFYYLLNSSNNNFSMQQARRQFWPTQSQLYSCS